MKIRSAVAFVALFALGCAVHAPVTPPVVPNIKPPVDTVTATIAPSSQTGVAPYTATLTGAATSSSKSAINSWSWNFGQTPYQGCIGTVAKSKTCPQVTTHTFTVPGTYTIYFGATDVAGSFGQTKATVIVTAAPTCFVSIAWLSSGYVLPVWITALSWTNPADVMYGGTKTKPTMTAITNSSWLPAAMVGYQYCFWLQAQGGVPPYTFTSSSVLPFGLTLSTSGLLSGVPTVPGAYDALLFSVKDSSGTVVMLKPRSIEVCAPGVSCNGFGQ